MPGCRLLLKLFTSVRHASLCDGDEASPSVLSVEPALCRSALHPPSRGRWQPCSAQGMGFASPPQCRSTLTLAADSAPVRLRLRCSVLHKSCLRMFQSHFWLDASRSVTGETKPSALSVVPAWAVQHCTPSRGGWQVFAAFDAWVSPPSSCWLPSCYLESASSCGLLHSFAILDVSVSLIPG